MNVAGRQTRPDGGASRQKTVTARRSRWLGGVALVMAALAGSGPAASEGSQDVDVLERLAGSYLEGELEARHARAEVETGRVDTRLRLQPCAEEALEAFIPHGRDPERASTVGIRCTGDAPWTVYVTVRSRVYSDVVVARRALQRGTRIQASDVELAERDVSRMRDDWVREPELVVGMELRRTVRQGRAVQSSHVEAPRLVRRGSRVVIEATDGNGLRITGVGEALEHGREGDRVRVRNVDSDREVEGRVVGPDRIEVAF